MSLTKLLVNPIKMFQKDVIAFLVVRRYDLGRTDDQIRYLNVRPNASIWALRSKVWLLLELPDFCDEIIVLKTSENVEIPLTELRKGNQPNRPFILEVYPAPPLSFVSTTASLNNKMITEGDNESTIDTETVSCFTDEDQKTKSLTNSTTTGNTTVNSQFRPLHNKGVMLSEPMTKITGISTCISTTSFISKLQGKKSRDNLTNILVKIQSDLNTLSKKLSTLETKMPS